jgi:methionyl-tRNA synthetase
MQKLLVDLHKIAILSQPFLPETSQTILNALENRERVILFDRV